MRIEYLRITNYKCFRDTGPVAMAPHFTVLVGQNNAGKTAFLESLKPTAALNKPHLEPAPSDAEFPRIPNPICEIEFGFSVSGDELRWRFLSSDSSVRFVTDLSDDEAIDGINRAFSQKKLSFGLVFRSSGGSHSWRITDDPLLEYMTRGAGRRNVTFGPSLDKQRLTSAQTPANIGSLDNLLMLHLTSSIYLFRAERLTPEASPITHTMELSTDASNLASVLLQLGTNPAAKTRFIEAIRTVFPSVFDVVSHPIEGNLAQIKVTNRMTEQNEVHPGISVPLGDSGSSIGQVAAILYVALTSHLSKVIVIDEPNSFLHPGAAKKLLQILNTLGHQYIITTHSPDVIRSADPDVLHLVKWNGVESVFISVNRTNIEDLRSILSEVGVRLGDVFGADNVLWVEGTTEERCFPLLLRRVGISLSSGTAIVAMINTGDLESARARASLAWELYERLSEGSTLVPRAVAFSFDQEGRSGVQIEDMKRRSKGLVHFLPRRTYENFLLHPAAINAALEFAFKESSIDLVPDAVESWFSKKGGGSRYSPKAKYGGADWVRTVNAPLLLADLFSELSGARLEYRKTVHSVQLTEWILENDPEHLSELTTYVRDLVSQPDDGLK